MPILFTGQNGVLVKSITKVKVLGCKGVLPSVTHHLTELAEKPQNLRQAEEQEQAREVRRIGPPPRERAGLVQEGQEGQEAGGL